MVTEAFPVKPPVSARRAARLAALLAACAALSAFGPAQQPPEPVPVARTTLLNELAGGLLRANGAAGFTLVLVSQHGAVYDPVGKEGLTLLGARYLLERFRAEAAICALQAGTAAPELSLWVTNDTVQFSAKGENALLQPLGEALGRVLSARTWDERLFLSLRDGLAAEIAEREGTPVWQAESAFHAVLFSPFPYWRNPNGASAAVRTLALNDMVRLLARTVMPNRIFVRLQADLPEDRFRSFLIQSFGSLVKGLPLAPQFAPPNPDNAVLSLVETPGAAYAAIVVGAECPRRKHEDYPALWIIARLLRQKLQDLAARRPEWRFETQLDAGALRGDLRVRGFGPAGYWPEVIMDVMEVFQSLSTVRYGLDDLEADQAAWGQALESRLADPAGRLETAVEMEVFRLGNTFGNAYRRPVDALIPEDIPLLGKTLFEPARLKAAATVPALPPAKDIPSRLQPYIAQKIVPAAPAQAPKPDVPPPPAPQPPASPGATGR